MILNFSHFAGGVLAAFVIISKALIFGEAATVSR